MPRELTIDRATIQMLINDKKLMLDPENRWLIIFKQKYANKPKGCGCRRDVNKKQTIDWHAKFMNEFKSALATAPPKSKDKIKSRLGASKLKFTIKSGNTEKTMEV